MLIGIAGFTPESFALAAILMMAGFLASLFFVDMLRTRERSTSHRRRAHGIRKHLTSNRVPWTLGLAVVLALATTLAALRWTPAPAQHTAHALTLAPMEAPESSQTPIVTDPVVTTREPGQAGAARSADAPDAVTVTAAIESWRQAWEARDTEKYLAAYSPDFQPADGSTLTNWRAQRQGRIGRARDIQIVLDEIQVTVNGDQANAHFRQRYNAAQVRDTVRKRLRLVRSGSRWQIIDERVEEAIGS
jgi:ketosteroid isomerase-like protein